MPSRGRRRTGRLMRALAAGLLCLATLKAAASGLDLHRKALEAAERRFGPDHPEVATQLNNLAAQYSGSGQHAQALALYERSAAIYEQAFGPDHDHLAIALHNLAQAHRETGRDAVALPLYRRSLAIWEKLHGPEHPYVIASLTLQAKLHLRRVQPALALALAERALAAREKTLGPRHPDVGSSLNILAEVHEQMGQYALALPLYQRSLAIVEDAFGPQDPQVAVPLNSLTLLHLRMGHHAQALASQQRALAIVESSLAPSHLHVATSQNNLAQVYTQTGQYAQALLLYQRSLALFETALGPEHPGVATSLSNLASTHRKLAQPTLALPLYQRSLAILEKAFGPAHPEVANTLHELAGLHDDLGEHSLALPLHLRGLSMREQALGPNHPDVAGSLNSLANWYWHMGQHRLALPLAQRSVAITEKALGAWHPDLAAYLANLASLHEELGQIDLALPLHQRSLSLSEQVLGAEHPNVSHGLNNLALHYQHRRQYDLALPLHERALAIREKVLGSDHTLVAGSLGSLGQLQLAMGRPEQARSSFVQAIARAQTQPMGRQVLWRVQGGLANLSQQSGDNASAILWRKEAVNTLQSLRADVLSLDRDAQAAFIEGKRHIYTGLADLLIAEGRLAEAQVVLQMLKEHELHDDLQRAATTDPRTTTLELTGVERTRFARYYALRDRQLALGLERGQLDTRKKLGTLSSTEALRLEEIEKQLLPPLREAMLHFLDELQASSARLAQAEQRRSGDDLRLVETQLQKALQQAQRSDPGAKVAALQYVATERRLSILLSTAGAPPVARQFDTDLTRLRKQVMAVRALLSHPGSDLDALQAALRSLHALLIAPVEADLKALGATTLVLVPHDVLRYVPFAALMNGDRYLVQDYTTVLFNEAVRKDFSAAPPADWHLAAMGMTREVHGASGLLPALPAVRDEVHTVALKSGFTGKPYLDEEFTRRSFVAALAQGYSVLHVASHFDLVASRPEASSLFLGDRSPLTLADIARDQLRFDRFALVTFSACETGFGDTQLADGRDMESLGALVQNQGAQAVMATLWKVADDSTARLMERFYKRRAADKADKAGALREAQLAFIGNRAGLGRSRTHPYFWAPFVLMGDWR